MAIEHRKKLKLKKWILVTPQDLVESSTRKDLGDVAWFEKLRGQYGHGLQLEHWGHKELLSLFLETATICLYYYPELVSAGAARKHTIEDVESRYRENLASLYREIVFVGMSVYKPEATKGIPMEHIYIPLTVVPQDSNEAQPDVNRIDPLSLLSGHSPSVILGDPGSGKSTLLRFLALVGKSKGLQERCGGKTDERLPILVTLRRYADELKERKNLALLDYVRESIQADFSLPTADTAFFEYYLESGQAILLFDGLDEVGSPQLKEVVRDRIRSLTKTYPGNFTVVTSRIVGYENPFRFDEKEFGHFRITKLRLREMEQFVHDWYRVRIENEKERDANVQDLVRILRNDEHLAIRQLSENPLLLTIVALVHRIDAVLPDERVVLYQKCTETLLNTWHTWKFRGAEVRNRGKIERRNRRRMEVIAYWMHSQAGGRKKTQRAVVPYAELHKFLTQHIIAAEKVYEPESDPQDLAEGFLDFVKKRAGLMIEVGDGKYSFVHLTFQEYLASTNIITCSETQGIEHVWDMVREHCNDPRWSEVIRLLIAGLKSEDSQRFLIDSIFVIKGSHAERADGHLSRLLGGLLLDGLDQAQLRVSEILSCLLESCSSSKEPEEVRAATSILNMWLRKERSRSVLMDEAIRGLVKGPRKSKLNVGKVLTRYAISWPKDNPSSLKVDSFPIESHSAALLKLFFHDPTAPTEVDWIDLEINKFLDSLLTLALESPGTNFVASACQAIGSGVPPISRARGYFDRQMFLLPTVDSGPLHDFTLNSLSIANSGFPMPNRPERRPIEERQSTATLVRALKATILHNTRDFHPQELRMAALARRRALNGPLIRRIRNLGYHRMYRMSWADVLSDPRAHNSILELLCKGFALKPKSQWFEALRVGFLPEIPNRLTVWAQGSWEELERKLAGGDRNEADLYDAAFLLLLDSCLYVFEHHGSAKESPLRGLADLSREIKHPAVVVANCVRDISYGDESQTAELAMMFESLDPDYRRIFAGWHELSRRMMARSVRPRDPSVVAGLMNDMIAQAPVETENSES